MNYQEWSLSVTSLVTTKRVNTIWSYQEELVHKHPSLITRSFITKKKERPGKTVSLQARTCSRVHVANYMVLVSIYLISVGQIDISERASLLPMVRLQMTSMTATIQYKPVTSRAGNNNLAHHSYMATIKYHIHYPIFMTFMGAAVIFLTSYLYTVWTQVSYQTVSSTDGLGTRI